MSKVEDFELGELLAKRGILEDLKIAICPECKHRTIQSYCYREDEHYNEYLCMTCGTFLKEGMVLVEKRKEGL